MVSKINSRSRILSQNTNYNDSVLSLNQSNNSRIDKIFFRMKTTQNSYNYKLNDINRRKKNDLSKNGKYNNYKKKNVTFKEKEKNNERKTNKISATKNVKNNDNKNSNITNKSLLINREKTSIKIKSEKKKLNQTQDNISPKGFKKSYRKK